MEVGRTGTPPTTHWHKAKEVVGTFRAPCKGLMGQMGREGLKRFEKQPSGTEPQPNWMRSARKAGLMVLVQEKTSAPVKMSAGKEGD